MAASYAVRRFSGGEERPVKISEIHWHDSTHSLTFGKITLTLTPTEYRLLSPLRHGKPVSYAELAHQAYNYAVDDKVRVMMDKHIDRIRGKLRGSGIYIYCVLGYGYMLLPEDDEASSYGKFAR